MSQCAVRIVDIDQTLELVDETAILRSLRQDLPVNDLLHWLHEHYPDLSDATVLRMYHLLIERREWEVTAADIAGSQNLTTVRVLHHPHAHRRATTAAQHQGST